MPHGALAVAHWQRIGQQRLLPHSGRPASTLQYICSCRWLPDVLHWSATQTLIVRQHVEVLRLQLMAVQPLFISPLPHTHADRPLGVILRQAMQEQQEHLCGLQLPMPLVSNHNAERALQHVISWLGACLNHATCRCACCGGRMSIPVIVQ